MTHNRLEELLANPDINNQELAEIIGAALLSISKHSKDIKTTLQTIEKEIAVIQKKLDLLEEKSNFGFGIIMDDDEEA